MVEMQSRGQFLGFLHDHNLDGVVGLEALGSVKVRATDTHEIDFVEVSSIEPQRGMTFAKFVPQAVWE